MTFSRRFLYNALGSSFVLLASVLLLWGPLSKAFTVTWTGHSDCYPVNGASRSFRGTGSIDFEDQADEDRLCFDSNGNVFTSDGPDQAALSTHSVMGEMDWAWEEDAEDTAVIDFSTGYLSGYVKLTYLEALYDSGRSKGLPPVEGENELWVWLDWQCELDAGGVDPCAGAYASQWPRVNTSTGRLSGYVWSDYMERTTGNGYVRLRGADITMPPRQLQVFFDVLTADEHTPDSVDLVTAPLADGGDYWRVRAQVFDQWEGRFLDKSEINVNTFTVFETPDSNVYLDQIHHNNDAIAVSPKMDYLGCMSSSVTACSQTESDADSSTSFNTFVTSGAPTSNMLGLDDEPDGTVDYYTDRRGCPWIYQDQYSPSSKPGCLGDAPDHDDKDEVFFARSNDRNKYAINSIVFNFTYTGGDGDYEVFGDDFYEDSNPTACNGIPMCYDPEDDIELAWAPRFQVNKFVAEYDGVEHEEISTELMKSMILRTEAFVQDASDEARAMYPGLFTNHTVNYQVDVDTTLDPAAVSNTLLINTDLPVSTDTDGPDSTNTTLVRRDPGTVGPYLEELAMGYGVRRDDCPGGGCPATNNDFTNPTAEVWVCDKVTEVTHSARDESCYYVAYLPIQDPHIDPPEDMVVYGAINSTLDSEDLLDTANNQDVSILGNVDNFRRRNILNRYLSRLVLGYTNAGYTGGTIDSSGEVATGSNILELMSGRLKYAEGDVVINGSFEGTLAVRNGNVFIEGDLNATEAGGFGIIVFGDGTTTGHVYVAPTVTEVFANMFLDGSLLSYDGNASSVSGGGLMSWASSDSRVELLKHQLHLKGSLVSRNTIGGAADDSAGSWASPTGASDLTVYEDAVEYDLNKLRQFRLCYPLDAAGNVDTSGDPELCGDSGDLSTFGEDNAEYASFIIEYAAPGNIPVFVIESR